MQQELISCKQMLNNQPIDQDELLILKEQNKLIEEQIQKYQQLNYQPIEKCNQEQDKLKLQLEVNNQISNEQQEKCITLQKEYTQLVIDYEKRIRNLEMHYLEQSKQQRIQIQNWIKVLKDNSIFEIQLSRRQSSQPEQISENKLLNINRQNFNTQNSPDKDQQNQKLLQDDTTNNLREDIKKRLTNLKLQMDQQN